MDFISEKTRLHYASSHPILDVGYKKLIEQAKQLPKFVLRGKSQIFTYYQSVDKNCIVTFITPSGTTPGVYWVQKVQLLDLPKLWKQYNGKKKPLDVVRMALNGNVKLSCKGSDGKDEPSFLYYGFKYLATIKGYNLGGGEDRFPKIRNPRLKGSMCKHLRMVVETLIFHNTIITKDLTKLNFFA